MTSPYQGCEVRLVYSIDIRYLFYVAVCLPHLLIGASICLLPSLFPGGQGDQSVMPQDSREH